MNRQRLATCFLLTALLVGASNASVFGQGKLGRVRDVVRQSKPKPERKKETAKKETREKQARQPPRRDDHRSRKGSSKVRSRRPAVRRRAAPSLAIGASYLLPPPRVKEVHVLHHAPQEPVYQPVVTPVVSVVEEGPVEADYVAQNVPRFDWGIRLSAIGGTDFDNIAFGRLDLLLQIPNGLGVDTSVAMLRESGLNYRDHLYLGDVNFVYEPIKQTNFRMRFGFGVNWLSDSYGGDTGFNMTSGFDWQLTKQTLMTGEIDLGNIGDTDITHAQISLGRAVNQAVEWTVGYDYLDIGGVTIGSAFTGLRFRF